MIDVTVGDNSALLLCRSDVNGEIWRGRRYFSAGAGLGAGRVIVAVGFGTGVAVVTCRLKTMVAVGTLIVDG